MNLIDAPWIPVRRASGARTWVAPWHITDDIVHDPIVALDAARPDFNGALMQFLIGLVQTTTSMDSQEAWEAAMDAPPNAEILKAQFDTVRSAFELDGEGPRFMQDLTISPEDATKNHIAALLIETPGVQAEERNADHFVKRGAAAHMCYDCAATALFALQANAPAGGQGNRTSLRGGGPLTTLVAYTRQSQSDHPAILWRDVWLNIRPQREFLLDCDSNRDAPHSTFPWLGSIDTLQPGDETQPMQVHPAQMFWGMPRRIRLSFHDVSQGLCEICGRQVKQRLSGYIAKNYGTNYKGPWRHPLTPYYRQKEDDPALPMHPQPGGIGYRYWLGLVLGMAQDKKRIEPARVVQYFIQSDRRKLGQYRLWAFGYDMDNMKARCWYEATFPLYDLRTRRAQELVIGVASRAIDAAEWVASCTRNAIKDAWFSAGAEVRGNLSFVDATYWSRTEEGFYSILGDAVQLARDGREFDATAATREKWRKALIRASEQLFDENAASADIGIANPKRIAGAQKNLLKQLQSTKLQQLLALAPLEQTKKRKSRILESAGEKGAVAE
jgi:CRISPR system Cascade subunit CasA